MKKFEEFVNEKIVFGIYDKFKNTSVGAKEFASAISSDDDAVEASIDFLDAMEIWFKKTQKGNWEDVQQELADNIPNDIESYR